jgi:toxin-antitoxin system PIN domain toxin
MTDLLDANVWLALSAPDHVHHARVRRYWDQEAADQLTFCRMTSLALLRLLTNVHVMGEAVLTGHEAWQAMETWRASPRVTFLPEPAGLDEVLGRWARELDIRGGGWTDAYLAAFAAAAGSRLVTFDSDFGRFAGLPWLLLDTWDSTLADGPD